LIATKNTTTNIENTRLDKDSGCYYAAHKKHKHLIPEIDRVLKEMLLDGTIEKLKD
jgi:hypothetical protein